MNHYKIVYSVMGNFLSCDTVDGDLPIIFGAEECIAMLYSGQYIYHVHADTALDAVKRFLTRLESSMLA